MPGKEQEPQTRNPYIGVVGAVGVGKTEITDLLVGNLGMHCFREQYPANKNLPLFYTCKKGDEKYYAFKSQIFFITVKAEQMAQIPKLLPANAVAHDPADPVDEIIEEVQWRMGFISDDEHRTYLTAKKVLIDEALLPKPDIFYAVTASEEVVMQRIETRGREMELIFMKKYPDYFPNIVRAFNEWRLRQTAPVVEIPTDGLNFIDDFKARAQIIKHIQTWTHYYLVSPNQLNSTGRDGTALVWPDSLRPSTAPNIKEQFLP